MRAAAYLECHPHFSAWSGYYYTITAEPVRPPRHRDARAFGLYDSMSVPTLGLAQPDARAAGESAQGAGRVAETPRRPRPWKSGASVSTTWPCARVRDGSRIQARAVMRLDARGQHRRIAVLQRRITQRRCSAAGHAPRRADVSNTSAGRLDDRRVGQRAAQLRAPIKKPARARWAGLASRPRRKGSSVARRCDRGNGGQSD